MLRIMDTQNPMAEERSMDSFLCGFHLALEAAAGPVLPADGPQLVYTLGQQVLCQRPG